MRLLSNKCDKYVHVKPKNENKKLKNNNKLFRLVIVSCQFVDLDVDVVYVQSLFFSFERACIAPNRLLLLVKMLLIIKLYNIVHHVCFAVVACFFDFLFYFSLHRNL